MQSKHRHTEKGTAYSNTRLYKVWCSMKGRCYGNFRSRNPALEEKGRIVA